MKLVFLILISFLTTSLSQEVLHPEVPKDHDHLVEDVGTHADLPKDHVQDVPHADLPKDHAQDVPHADLPKDHVKDIPHADPPKAQEQHVKDVPHAEVPEGYEQHPKDVFHAQAPKDNEQHSTNILQAHPPGPKDHDQHNVTVGVEVVKATAERALSDVNQQNLLSCKESQTVKCETVCKTKNFSPNYYCQVTTFTGPIKQTVNCRCSLFEVADDTTTTVATTTEVTTTPTEETTIATTMTMTTTTVTESSTSVAANIKALDVHGSNVTSVGNSSSGNQTTTPATPLSKTTRGQILKGKATLKSPSKKPSSAKKSKKKLTSPHSSKKATPQHVKKAAKGSKTTPKPFKKVTPAPKGSKTTPKHAKTTAKALKGFQTSTNLCTSLALSKICTPICSAAKFSSTKACKISSMSCNCDLYAPKKAAGLKKADLSNTKLKKDAVCNCGENSPGSIFPWSVNIQMVQRKAASCSGVLISPIAVLTTASCLQSYNLKSSIQNIRVMLDDKNPGIRDGEVAVKINSTIIHPLYNKTGHQNNVAILILESPVNLTQKINPICLVPASLIPADQFIGVNVTAFGWAGTQAKGSDSGRLLSGVVQTEKCTTGFDVSPNNFDDYICAKTSSKDVCNIGDGAVLSTVIRRKIRLIAMGSFASNHNRDCSKKPASGAFFKTSKVNDWILQNTDALPCSN